MHGISSRLQRTFKEGFSHTGVCRLSKEDNQRKRQSITSSPSVHSPRQEPPKHFSSPCPRLGGAHSGFDKITMVLACCIINPLSG